MALTCTTPGRAWLENDGGGCSGDGGDGGRRREGGTAGGCQEREVLCGRQGAVVMPLTTGMFECEMGEGEQHLEGIKKLSVGDSASEARIGGRNRAKQ